MKNRRLHRVPPWYDDELIRVSPLLGFVVFIVASIFVHLV